MASYIHTSRQDIHILDVKQTIAMGNQMYVDICEIAKTGDILFIGTKKQAFDSVTAAAESCNMPYITSR